MSQTVSSHPVAQTLLAWRRRLIVAALALIGIGLLVAMALAGNRPQLLLDPDGTGPGGGRALAQVLAGQGVHVQVVRSGAEALAAIEQQDGGATLLVANPEYLSQEAARRVTQAVTGHAGRLVLVGLSGPLLEATGVPARGYDMTGQADLAGGADCASPLVPREDRLVGSATARYEPDEDAAQVATACFLLTSRDKAGKEIQGGSLLLTLPAASGRSEVVLFGAPTAWTNRSIDEAGNAGLALRTLGKSPQLIWYQPSLADLAASTGDTDVSPWPGWLAPALWLCLAAFILFALAMGRRLGPLVPEPLPVIVPAAESTVSRGRLYRRSGDRTRAAAVLRWAALARLRERLRMRAEPPEHVVTAAAGLTDLPVDTVHLLLLGPDPADDAALVRLAHDLTDLEEKVRHHE